MDGQSSSAATSASCVNSSASGTSRSIRDSDVIRRGCSMRQAARMAASMSAAVIAADRLTTAPASGVSGRIRRRRPVRAGRDEGAQLASAFPARHVVEMELHELPGHRQRLLLVAQFEDGIAADHFLGFDKGAVGDAELAVGNGYPRALLQAASARHCRSSGRP